MGPELLQMHTIPQDHGGASFTQHLNTSWVPRTGRLTSNRYAETATGPQTHMVTLTFMFTSAHVVLSPSHYPHFVHQEKLLTI